MNESSPSDLSIAVFGVINAGKSSLINALTGSAARETSPIGGTTRAVEGLVWREIASESGESFKVKLIDTPGLEEVDGSQLAVEAVAAAETSDLVLLVIAEDLTDSAHAALERLRVFGKPMIVALNKVDLLDPVEEERVLASVRDRLRKLVLAADVIPIAASPVIREKIKEADGSARWVVRREEPRIAALEARLITALIESAEDLKALNAASQTASALLAARPGLKAERRAAAERVADETSFGLALAMAVNPIPLVDFLTGPGGLAILVFRVAGAYGEVPDRPAVSALVRELLKGGRKVFWGSVLGIFAGGAMKVLPGIGHVAGATAQAASAGYVAHVLGRALVDYFENGHDWGEGGLIAELERIAARTDRKALTQGLVDRLKSRLGV